MKVRELIEKLQEMNPEAPVLVIVHNRAEQFSLTWGGGECCPKERASDVGFYVDRLCQHEQEDSGA